MNLIYTKTYSSNLISKNSHHIALLSFIISTHDIIPSQITHINDTDLSANRDFSGKERDLLMVRASEDRGIILRKVSLGNIGWATMLPTIFRMILELKNLLN